MSKNSEFTTILAIFSDFVKEYCRVMSKNPNDYSAAILVTATTFNDILQGIFKSDPESLEMGAKKFIKIAAEMRKIIYEEDKDKDKDKEQPTMWDVAIKN